MSVLVLLAGATPPIQFDPSAQLVVALAEFQVIVSAWAEGEASVTAAEPANMSERKWRMAECFGFIVF